MNDTVWVVLFERDDTLAAGPFPDANSADRVFGGDDDVYIAPVSREWFEDRVRGLAGPLT